MTNKYTVQTFLDGKVSLYGGDNRDVLRDLPDNSIDSIVTDPPYALVSIVKRFGGGSAKPANDNDVYARASAGFMGKKWDTGEVAFSEVFWAECLRVLKPGGHVVAFSGTRTYHRMAVAIEDAGFEIRDQCKWMHEDDSERDAFLASLNDEQRAQFIKLFEEHGAGQLSWDYGSGFPKSHDVSKGIDKKRDDLADIHKVAAFVASARNAAGVSNREIDILFGFNGMAGHWTNSKGPQAQVPKWGQWIKLKEFIGFSDEMDAEVWRLNGRKGQPGDAWQEAEVIAIDKRMNEPSGIVGIGQGERIEVERQIKAANSEAARQWQGWGTALKPAWEPICLARKPLSEKTVAANVLRWGTGALNIGATRVGDEVRHAAFTSLAPCHGNKLGDADTAAARRGTRGEPKEYVGRWPANICHDGSDEVRAAFPQTSSGGGDKGNKNPETQWGGLRAKAWTSAEYNQDSGSAARFFFNSKETDEQWLARNLPNAHAKPAANYFNLQSELAVSVLRNAADLSTLQLEPRKIDCPEHSMSVTPSELRRISDILTETMLSFERKSSLESLHERLSLSGNPVKFVATRRPTGTITITISLSKSDGSAEDATFSITPQNSVVGAKDCAPSTTRFHYSAKASKADRAGSKHPTVKPVALMSWLARLITPPGGTVLDPFAGSGTTGAAAEREGFACVLIEREAEYVEDIKRRLSTPPQVASAVAAQPADIPANDNQPAPQTDLFAA